MAFTGTATQALVSDRMVRITGLSLANTAAGTISLFGGGGNVELPDAFNPEPYRDIDLAESLEVSFVAAATLSAAPLRVSVTKTASPLLITLTNDDGTNATPALEIFVKFH